MSENLKFWDKMSPEKISAKTGGKKVPKNDVSLWKQPCFFVDF